MRRIVAGVAGSVLLLGGGYAYADARDVVPGWITAAPVEVPQAPFITAAPVVAAPEPTAAPVADLDPDAPRPDAATVQSLAEAVRADPRTGESTNISVIDYLDGTVYADLSAADPQVPASTTKLLTAVAAVGHLGADFRTRTTVTWNPTTRTLTLVAGGDVMLGAGEGHGGAVGAGDDPAQGWAGLGDLAAQVSAAVGDDAAGLTVVVDDLAFPGPAWPEEWPDYAFDMGYAAPVTGLAVNGARLSDDNYAQRAADPSLHAAGLFIAALEERGLTVEGEATRASSPVRDDAGATEVAAVESAPLAEVARHLLAVSDNTVSEAVARVLALAMGRPATPAGGASAITLALRDLGVPTAGLELYDGAGYSDRNQISPAMLTAALTVAREEPGLFGLLSWLPLAGLEGTVESRYVGSPVAGFWRAKTGSLTGVTSIAGVIVTADGRALAVAILADGMPYGQERPQSAFDEFLAALAECGCEG